jgi:hypothetical protein
LDYKQNAPAGLYAAPQLMYRRMWITGNYMEYEEEEEDWVEKEITRHLNVFAGGVILGAKLPFMKVLTVDVFIGGNIRLSKYNDEKVLPGIKIGITLISQEFILLQESGSGF